MMLVGSNVLCALGKENFIGVSKMLGVSTG